MRRLFIAVVSILMLSSSAHAQDWDGWFVGVDAGYIARTDESPGFRSYMYEGMNAGFVAGHWWQVDPITLGFDVGASLGGAKTSVFEDLGFGFTDYVEGGEAATITIRAKLGAPIGDNLVYVAGGLQYLHNFFSSTWTTPGSITKRESWSSQSGFTLAVGAEHRLAPHLSLKGEVGYNAVWPTISTNYSGWNAKAGLNYYF